MAISLALVQIDHPNIVERGLPVVNRALESGEPAPVRDFIKSLPFDESEQLVQHIQSRVARLREAGAPAVVVESEERRLASVRPPEPSSLDRASLEALRLMLGRWCMVPRTVDLDMAWDLIHWYCDPARRMRADGDWQTQPPDFRPSAFDYAVYGREPYPLDASGQPVIRTGGDPEMSRYNPPDTVAEIAAAVAQVSADEWKPIETNDATGRAKRVPYLAEIADHLEYARQAFGRLAQCYQAAARHGFGVSVEFY